MRRFCVALWVGCLATVVSSPALAQVVAKADVANSASAPMNLGGDWRMLLPAGFEHPVKLTPHRDGYLLEAGGIVSAGPYRLRDKKLAFVGVDERRRFEWIIRSPYLLTLGEHDAANGAEYAGAILFRESPTAILRREQQPPQAPAKTAQPARPEAGQPERTPLSIEELNALVKSGDYTEVRKSMIGRELTGIAVVEKVAPWSNLSLNVRLQPSEWWSASLFGWTNFEELKPGDQIEFRGLMLEEGYANIAVWVSSWKKVKAK